MARMFRRWFGWGDFDCRDTRELGSAYLEDDLPAKKKSRMQGHLDKCPPCRAFIDTLAATIGVLARFPRVTPPQTFKQSINERIREEDGPQSQP